MVVSLRSCCGSRTYTVIDFVGYKYMSDKETDLTVPFKFSSQNVKKINPQSNINIPAAIGMPAVRKWDYHGGL